MNAQRTTSPRKQDSWHTESPTAQDVFRSVVLHGGPGDGD